METTLQEDFKLANPANVVNFVDDYNELEFSFPATNINPPYTNFTVEKSILKVIVPQVKYGVIKKFAYGHYYGNNDILEYCLYHNGKRIPLSLTSKNESLNVISSSPNDLQDTCILVQANDIIEVKAICNSTLLDAVLTMEGTRYFKSFARITGWYY
jgi:hypothetical protein